MPAIVAFNHLVGPILVDCVVSEKHSSELEITEIPIESGSRITDHAFVLPKKISLDIATDNAAAAYNALVAFQETRVPFIMVSGLYVYQNMLIRSLEAERDKTFSRILRVIVDLQEIIIVSTGYAADTSSSNSESSSQKTSSEKSTDAATADRTSSTTERGDVANATTAGESTGVNDTSILRRAY